MHQICTQKSTTILLYKYKIYNKTFTSSACRFPRGLRHSDDVRVLGDVTGRRDGTERRAGTDTFAD